MPSTRIKKAAEGDGYATKRILSCAGGLQVREGSKKTAPRRPLNDLQAAIISVARRVETMICCMMRRGTLQKSIEFDAAHELCVLRRARATPRIYSKGSLRSHNIGLLMEAAGVRGNKYSSDHAQRADVEQKSARCYGFIKIML